MSYKDKILAFLSETSEPVDVEKIRRRCDIGNWITALNNSLELFIQGKIQGQKTSKGWVFWTHQKKYLEPWEEVVGILERIEPSDTEATAIFTCTIQKQIAIALPKDQPETNQLKKLIGQKIGILKTDDPKRPYAIRRLMEHPVAQKSSCWLWWCRQSLLWVALKLVAWKFALWQSGLRLSWWF